MREIRFRAWDNAKNHLYSIGEESDIHFELTSGGTFIGYDLNEDEDSPLRKLEHLKYMQYTGIKDKNGVEIYEGDILRIWEDDDYVPNRDSGGGIIDYDMHEGFSQLGAASFHDAWFVYETKKHLAGKKMHAFAPLDSFSNREVIGNIYEHPHLLEQEAPS